MTEIIFAAQIALRSTGASTSPSSRPCSRSAAKARVRPRSAVKIERDPEEADLGAVGGIGRQREVEDDQRGDDEEEHRRQRVARPQLEQHVLARERRDVRGVGAHARASRAVARVASRAGS